MEREIVLTTQQYKGVTFTNFPGYRNSENNEVTHSLLDEVLCEDIAVQIPAKFRGSVSVDFAKLNYEELLAETKAKHGIKRTMTDDEQLRVEEHLLQHIFGEREAQRP